MSLADGAAWEKEFGAGKNDKISHPVHYTQGIECWDYILSHKMGYLEGNIIKYVTRYRYKDGLDDLRKAQAYLKRLIEQETPNMKPVESPIAGTLADVRRLNGAIPLLDGRNCAPTCGCPDHLAELNPELDWSPAVCAIPFGIEALVEADAFPFRSNPDPDPYYLGDYRRGGPVTNSWMKRPCRYDPND